MARNEGAIQLARTGKTHADIAKALGVSRVAVSHWLAGTRKPLAPGRNRILEVFGIATDAWDRHGVRGSPFKPSERKRNKRGSSRRGGGSTPRGAFRASRGGLQSSSVRRAFGLILADFCVTNKPVPWRCVQAAWSPRVSRRMTAVL